MNKIGQEIGGFEITREIARGGMGVIYECKKNDEKYVMKVMHEDIFNPLFYIKQDIDNYAERFSREIQALYYVRDKAVARFIDDGHFKDENHDNMWVVMEYVDGETLREIIQEDFQKPKNERLTLDKKMEIFKKIVDGLKAIHKQHIVHRDVKPTNIMITPDNDVKIIDFGLAKFINYEPISKVAQRIGTTQFMSPEQAKGEAVDYRADYFSLGSVLYYLLSGYQPFGGHSAESLLFHIINSNHQIDIKRFVPQIPKNIENLLQALHQKKREDRPQNIDEIYSYIEPKRISVSRSFSTLTSDKNNGKISTVD